MASYEKAPRLDYSPTTDVIFSKQIDKPATFWSNKKWYFLSFAFAIIALITITIVVVYMTRTTSAARKDDSTSIFIRPGSEPIGDPPPDEPVNENLTLSNNKRIFTKEEWGGHAPQFVRKLPHPTPYVVISHTVTEMCFVSNLCAAILRSIQDFHVAQYEMPDIGHNFLVDGAGNVYEGRGWDATNMHDGFVKRINIGVGLIGNFLYDQPTSVQMESTQLLLDKGVKMKKLDPDYKLFSHNWTMPTESPGPNVYRIISTWSHFTIPDANLMNSNGSSEVAQST